VGLLWRVDLDYSTDLVGFILVTCVVALVGGLGPALSTAFLGAGLLNFFFTAPYYSLAVASPQNVITLIVMAIVAVLVALVVDRAARLAEQSARARTEAALLASYARTVLTSPYPLARLLEKVKENFGLESVALLERKNGEWERVACVGPKPCDDPDEADADVPVTADVHLALRGRTLPASDQRVLEAAAGQALLALRQQRMAAETAEAQRRAETTELRTALLSAVGHDLRTPLTSIKAAIGSLRDPELRLSGEDTAELMATVEESADRLTGLVDNLLDSSRLATGSVSPRLRPVGYDEVVAWALSGVDERRTLSIDVDERLPEVVADIGLLERVVANVVDNALRHGRLSPRRLVDVDGDGRIADDEPEIAIRASAHGDQVELRVVDHGPGLPKKAADSVFTPFQRLGDRDSTPGVGLGLSVAKGFTEAMGGTISAEDTPGGGLTIVISLPVHKRVEEFTA
jgi:two-component system sensor histidine kinase KdpD